MAKNLVKLSEKEVLRVAEERLKTESNFVIEFVGYPADLKRISSYLANHLPKGIGVETPTYNPQTSERKANPYHIVVRREA
jgi:hypothetical protein